MNDTDMRLFCEGNCYKAYEFFGAIPEIQIINGIETKGVQFRLWAPNAKEVQVIGSFNNWSGSLHTMALNEKYGIWSLFIPEANIFDEYKFHIKTRKERWIKKADPYARLSGRGPNNNSIVFGDGSYIWSDAAWMDRRKERICGNVPMNIYEIHLGSWKRNETKYLNYREISDLLIPYLHKMKYNFVEIMPVTEYSADVSWGYQTTGYFSVTSRYGSPDDFKYLIDSLHGAGIGVILDWVPSHFAKDKHGLENLDGTPLYENQDVNKSVNKDWGTLNFDFEKEQVQSFMISSAFYFFDKFHADGLRVDAVSNMLYYGYRGYGNPAAVNEYGGREYISAIDFIKKLNRNVKKTFKNVLMIAEESGSWENVTKPDYLGGLGFDYKWNMGWMNDSLEYMKTDPKYRSFRHSLMKDQADLSTYEKSILPLSHDEVVNGKRSVLNKMGGSKKYADYRLFMGYMMTCPGKKLTFMGNEFAQESEWNFRGEINWEISENDENNCIMSYIKDLNRIYIDEKSLWEQDCQKEGFLWIDGNNSAQSVFSYIRKGKDKSDFLVVICNFSENKYEEYKLGVPRFVDYKELINSDGKKYGGTDFVNPGKIRPVYEPWNGQLFHINIRLPAQSVILLKPQFL